MAKQKATAKTPTIAIIRALKAIGLRHGRGAEGQFVVQATYNRFSFQHADGRIRQGKERASTFVHISHRDAAPIAAYHADRIKELVEADGGWIVKVSIFYGSSGYPQVHISTGAGTERRDEAPENAILWTPFEDAPEVDAADERPAPVKPAAVIDSPGIDFDSVHEGDQLHFLTRDTGYGASGDIVSRLGRVESMADQTIFLVDVSGTMGNRARLTRKTWREREPRLAARRPKPAPIAPHVPTVTLSVPPNQWDIISGLADTVWDKPNQLAVRYGVRAYDRTKDGRPLASVRYGLKDRVRTEYRDHDDVVEGRTGRAWDELETYITYALENLKLAAGWYVVTLP